MIITDEIIIQSIKGARYIDFIKLFAKAKDIIDNIKKEDNPLKIIAFFDKLKSQKGFNQKVKMIFGKDSVYQEKIEETPKSRKKFVYDVLEIEEDKYKEWFKKFCMEQKNITLYQVCYNCNKKCYVVTVKYISTSV